ncbi:polymorphic toxin-type HINT domain-containing protein [Dactylosporangium sp. CA-233914]|uniref:polymorphic toxin-type HINT domain-containing protein n=1 Tax=Dactylosporangium sp. CA-233914 TaxID=3239934 RepID=UPI003D92D877
MLDRAVIDALFPADLPEPGHWEQQYPPRQLPEAAQVTRFAPSPTGFVHIGGIYVATIDRDIATSSGGVYFVRVEDTDQSREVEGALSQFAGAFDYFHLAADEDDERGAYGPYRPVKMADGSQEPIKDVKVGDTVQATDPRTGKTSPRTVLAVKVNRDNALTDLTVKAPNGTVAAIRTSQNHPFWDSEQQAWVSAGDLRPGAAQYGSAGASSEIVGVRNYLGARDMYDLTVADIYTYYVIAGNVPVLVHNCGPSLDDLAAAGKAPDKNGLTRAGSEQQKHRNRETNTGQWDVPTGKRNPTGWKSVGQDTLEDILTHPKTATQSYVNRAGDNVMEFLIPDKGVQFRQRGGVGDWVLHSFRES